MQKKFYNVVIRWKDEPGQTHERTIKVGKYSNVFEDNGIFFYVESEEKLQDLMKEDNGEDFVITQILD